MRVAEMYLLNAEAAARTGDDGMDIYGSLDAVVEYNVAFNSGSMSGLPPETVYLTDLKNNHTLPSTKFSFVLESLVKMSGDI